MESILNFPFQILKVTNYPYFARKLKLVILHNAFSYFVNWGINFVVLCLHICRQQSSLTKCLNDFRSGCDFDHTVSFAATESLSKYICNNRQGFSSQLWHLWYFLILKLEWFVFIYHKMALQGNVGMTGWQLSVIKIIRRSNISLILPKGWWPVIHIRESIFKTHILKFYSSVHRTL